MTQPWTMPEWMEKYRGILEQMFPLRTLNHSVEQIMNGWTDSAKKTLSVQIETIERLHAAGMLK